MVKNFQTLQENSATTNVVLQFFETKGIIKKEMFFKIAYVNFQIAKEE